MKQVAIDPELDEIVKYNFLARNSKGEEKKQFSIFARLKMRLFYLPQKRKEVRTNNQQLLKAVDAILMHMKSNIYSIETL